MNIDFLDPFRPIDSVDSARERREPDRAAEADRERDRDSERVREDQSREREIRDDDSSRGTSIDEYA
ncbi:MAG: hypothetical protein ACOCYB_07070 [Alkalispirochaeta sp.]